MCRLFPIVLKAISLLCISQLVRCTLGVSTKPNVQGMLGFCFSRLDYFNISKRNLRSVFNATGVEIQRLREAYNTALKNYDVEQSLSFMTEGILSTISNSTLIHGKANLREYIRSKSDTKMYWVRTPKEIDINSESGLAWEVGTWKGYTPGSGQQSVTGGKYSAQWIKVSGEWKVNSELFVKLD